MGIARVEVDIVYEKAFGAPRQLRAVYTVLPSEKDLRNIIGPVTRALM